MNRPGNFLAMLLALAASTAEADTLAPFSEDGWYRWQFDAVSTSAELCCHTWKNNRPHQTACELDRNDLSFGGTSQDAENSETSASHIESPPAMSLFARVENGAITRLRPISPGCEVRSKLAWNDLGQVSNADSLAWLQSMARDGDRNLDSERMMAVALHAGPAAVDELVHTARRGTNRKLREDAIFWMGQLRVTETREVLLDLMTNGDTEKIREQAIFSYSQSPAPDRIDVLIDVIENTRQDMHDRKHALFWLAQADEPEGVDYIQDLLTGR